MKNPTSTDDTTNPGVPHIQRGEHFSTPQINRRDRDPLMPKFAADLLSGKSILLALCRIKLGRLGAASLGRFPSRQRFITHLRISMLMA
jgi:hypothetical protein